MLRAMLAILSGFAVMGITAIGSDMVLGRIMPSQFGQGGEVKSASMLAAILAYTLVACALGGYVTAAIAKDRPVQSAALLATLIAVMTIANLVVMPGSTPLWWKILGGALSGPSAFFGGWIRARTEKTQILKLGGRDKF